MQNIKGKLGLSRIGGAGSDAYMQLTIQDKTSGVQFATIEIGMAQFAYLLSGLHGIECNIDVRGLDLVGMTQEHKHEPVPVVKGLDKNDEDAIKATLIAFELDGWVANREDLFNHHKYNKLPDDFPELAGIKFDHTQTVNFHRFVETTK